MRPVFLAYQEVSWTFFDKVMTKTESWLSTLRSGTSKRARTAGRTAAVGSSTGGNGLKGGCARALYRKKPITRRLSTPLSSGVLLY